MLCVHLKDTRHRGVHIGLDGGIFIVHILFDNTLLKWIASNIKRESEANDVNLAQFYS